MFHPDALISDKNFSFFYNLSLYINLKITTNTKKIMWDTNDAQVRHTRMKMLVEIKRRSQKDKLVLW